jgi:multiple sugar transport system ATP-binding protein
MSGLLLKGISKRYLNGINAVSNFNLELADGEMIVIAGSAGAGKSTLLNIICGLETLDEGEIFIDSQSICEILPKDRKVAIIFPCHELYPNNTVYENLEFSLRLTKCPRSQIREKILKVAKELELVEFLDKMPNVLTPTEQFAAILARCVIKNPKIILIDEPFPSMDNEFQSYFRQAILTLNKKFNLTMIIATNNPDEVLAMSARTVILKNGYIQQVDNVKSIYQNPANFYVAQFMHHFNMTFFDAVLTEKNKEQLELFAEKGAMKFNLPLMRYNEKLKQYMNKEVLVGIRHFQLYIDDENADGISGEIDEIEVSCDGQRYAYFKSKVIDIKIPIDSGYHEGDKINLSLKDKDLLIFDKDTGKTILS